MQFTFGYHMYGSTQGSLDVEISNDGGTIWTSLWSVSGQNIDQWFRDTLSLGVYSGDTVKLRFRGVTGTNFYSDMAIDDIGLYDLLQNDAGISAFFKPVVPSCNISDSVFVTLNNYGTDTMVSAIIDWEVNGISQATHNWAGVIANNMNEQVFIGTYAGLGTNDTIKAWTSMPNGVVEAGSGSGNDTTTIIIKPGLSGNYTIGSMGNYLSFNDAISDLNMYGVCGPVVFYATDTLFNEQITLSEVMNMDVNNTVTFRSSNGAAMTKLTYSATGSSDNWVVNFDGGDFFTFKDLTIESSGITFGHVLEYKNNATNNTIDSCIIQGVNNVSTTSTNMALVYSASDIDSNNVFTNSTFNYGSYAFYFYGIGTANLESGTKITNNEFNNYYYYGIRLYYHEDAIISHNALQAGTMYTGSIYNIALYYCDGMLDVNSNIVSSSNYGYGLYFSNCDATPTNNGYIYNNSVSVGDTNSTSTSYGIYTSGCNQTDPSNSVNIESDSTSSRAAYFTGGSNKDIYNNNFHNDGPGYAIYLVNGVSNSDYNNLSAPNGTVGYFGSDINTLTNWQITTGFDYNSLSTNPLFTAFDTLRTCNDTLDEAGIANMMVTTDISGIARGNTPDIGAYEFDGLNMDLGMDTSLCNSQTLYLGDPNSPSTWTWSTGGSSNVEPVTGLNEGVVIATRTSACGVAVDTIMIFAIPDPIAAFTSSTSYLTGIFTNASTDADMYHWDFGDGDTSNLVDPVHVYPSTGLYYVTLSAYSQCGVDIVSDSILLEIASIEENDSMFSMYPNPANDVLIIETSENMNNAVFTLMDASGKEMQQRFMNGVKLELDLSAIEAGVYFIRIIDGENISTKKLIKN